MDNTTPIDGIDIHYEVHGEGEPLLLLHGFTGSAADWAHAGRERLAQAYRLVAPDARGHGGTRSPDGVVTHRRCALDTLALLDALDIERCRAVGLSMGGNILLHMATIAPGRLEAMVIVSATPRFPEHALAAMRALPAAQRALAEGIVDMSFTPAELGRISARTLVVQGDRDPLYPLELSLELYRAIPRSSLWVVPGGGHTPVFLDAADAFVRTALAFLGVRELTDQSVGPTPPAGSSSGTASRNTTA